MSRTVHVVPHTHWDREWYEPYPSFRIRLVELLDELLPRLESDPTFRHFQLDGQMAVVDDYLEIRPDQAERLGELVGAGRLSMGPWYVLPDEFLVSGETLVRDLQLGRARAARFGGAMAVGYLPDMFGHVAQMPQILSLFGLRDAVVWRGVPAAVHAGAFRWSAPDGSSVRAEYLSGGYGNGSDMPEQPDRLRSRIESFVELQGELVGDPVLWMAGMDHEAPPAHLGATVAALDRSDAPLRIRVGSLEQYLAATTDDGLDEVHGELRSGARANLLMGVASNRVDVKIAAARAERALERVAEPLDALWQPVIGRWERLLALAWLDVIRNAAHDSICACSHDEVVDAVLHRYAESTRTAHEVADRALLAAAGTMADAGLHIVNPSARRRDEVVEVTMPTEELGEAVAQVLEQHPPQEELHRTGAADAPVVVGRELVFEQPQTVSVRLVERGDDLLEVHLLPERDPDALSPGAALGELGRRCAATPGLAVATVLHRAEPTSRVLVRSGPVPGYGWRRFTPSAPTEPVSVEGATVMDNGVVRIEVDPIDGRFAMGPFGGFGRLVDAGDAGDTYNWSPPEADVVVDRPTTVHVECEAAGPLLARLHVRSTYVLPERVEALDGGGWARVGSTEQVVSTRLELRADEPFVRVEHRIEHSIRDHRLRVHLPLPERSAHSEAECAFAVVERPLWAEGGPNEWGVPTFPSRRFVAAGGLTVTHEGLCEYELVDLDGPPEQHGTTAGALALTLVRATGWLSRGPMASRPLPAGPELALEGPQLQGPICVRYAVSTEAVEPHELADRVWNPLRPVTAAGGGTLGTEGSLLDVRGAEVDSLRRVEGRLELRAHEAEGRPGILVVAGHRGEVVDLDGRSIGDFDGTIPLRAHQIVTLRLRDDGPLRPTPT